MKLLSNQVLEHFLSKIDGEINGFAWGLRSIIEGERELLLYFEHAKTRKKRQMAIGEEGERYIYPPAPNDHRTQGVGRDGACGLEVGRDRARNLGGRARPFNTSRAFQRSQRGH